MTEYRCTRNYPYRSISCPGFRDLKARQGYYLVAESNDAALAKMADKFPQDMAKSLKLPNDHPFYDNCFTALRWRVRDEETR